MKPRNVPVPGPDGQYRTSISGVPPRILIRARKIAARQRLTFSAFVVNALENYVAKHERALSKG